MRADARADARSVVARRVVAIGSRDRTGTWTRTGSSAAADLTSRRHAVDRAVGHAETLARAEARHVLSAAATATATLETKASSWVEVDVATLVTANAVAEQRARPVRHVVLESLHGKGDASAVSTAAHRDHVPLDAGGDELTLLVVADVEDVVDLSRQCRSRHFTCGLTHQIVAVLIRGDVDDG